MSATRRARVTFGVGIALILAAGAVTLTRAPPHVVRKGASTNIATQLAFAGTRGDATVCQADETLPAGISAVRVWLGAEYGARVHVTLVSGERVLTDGSRGPDWTSGSVTVPVASIGSSASQVKLCIEIGPNSEPIFFLGNETSKQEAALMYTPSSAVGQRLDGRLGVEYLEAGQGSWWSRILSVARHMGVGHALTGTWVALLIAGLVVAASAFAIGLALRELH